MSITAKEIAKMLGLSQAAVSLALNNKVGVSTATRIKVIKAAEENGYEFKYGPEYYKDSTYHGTIQLMIYKKSGAIVTETAFFLGLTQSIAEACKEMNIRLDLHYVEEGDLRKYRREEIDQTLGFIVIGTEMSLIDAQDFAKLNVPFVIVDTYFETVAANYIVINNKQGAYIATEHLMKRGNGKIGYLKSAYPIQNFKEREEGFYQALKEYGISRAKAVIHELAPSLEGAYADMKMVLEEKEELADYYFADNDLIACGVKKALEEGGYQIPGNISIVGFDNIPMCSYMSPALTSVEVNVNCMGRQAVLRLLELVKNINEPNIKIAISTHLVARESVK